MSARKLFQTALLAVACSAGENKIGLSFEQHGVSGGGPKTYSGTGLNAFNTTTAASKRCAISLTEGAKAAAVWEKAIGKRFFRKCVISLSILQFQSQHAYKIHTELTDPLCVQVTVKALRTSI